MPRTTPHVIDVISLTAGQRGCLAKLLEAFSPEGRRRFNGMARVRQVAAKSTVTVEGENPDEIGFVLDGTLATCKLLSEGRTHIVGLLVPTDLYGRVHEGPPKHRVEALSDARVIAIKRTSFEDLLTQEPEAARVLLVHVLEELDTTREWAVLRSESKVVNRVASFLVLSARRDRKPTSGPMLVTLSLTRADLASYLGTRPETLSRAFHELADRRLIRILDPYRFQIDDLSALLEMTGQDLVQPGG